MEEAFIEDNKIIKEQPKTVFSTVFLSNYEKASSTFVICFANGHKTTISYPRWHNHPKETSKDKSVVAWNKQQKLILMILFLSVTCLCGHVFQLCDWSIKRNTLFLLVASDEAWSCELSTIKCQVISHQFNASIVSNNLTVHLGYFLTKKLKFWFWCQF